MKNSTSLIINAALAVAVAVLFYLQFSSDQSASKPAEVVVEDINETPVDVVAFVDADTVMKYYKLAGDFRVAIQNEQSKYQKDLENKGRTFQSDLESFHAQAGQLSPTQINIRQQDFERRQQKLLATEQEYMQQMNLFQMEKEGELNKMVSTFLEAYCADKSYKMVLSQGAISPILYGDKGLDIPNKL